MTNSLSHERHVTVKDIRLRYLDHGGTQPHDVKIYMAAVGPQMLRLAGCIADGVVPNSTHTVDAIRKAVQEVKKGAEPDGRSIDDIGKVKLVPVELTSNKNEVLQAAKPRITQYIAQQPHIEGPSGVELELAQPIKDLIPWPGTERQDMEGARLIPDELADVLVCYGDEGELRAHLKEYTEAGVDMPIASRASKATIGFLAQGL